MFSLKNFLLVLNTYSTVLLGLLQLIIDFCYITSWHSLLMHGSGIATYFELGHFLHNENDDFKKWRLLQQFR